MDPINPDRRPLPSGWQEHYDPTKHTWYYIYTSSTPPQISATHPLGAPPEPSFRPLPVPNAIPHTARSGGPVFPLPEIQRYPSSPSSRSPPPSHIRPESSTLSFAQQLYASAAVPSRPATAPSSAGSSIPTPPLSPPPRSARSRPMLPNPPLSTNNSAFTSQSSQHHQYSISSSNLHSPSVQNNVAHHNPHRAQSYQITSTQSPHSAPHRAATYTAGAMSKPKGVPNLKTTLRPPPAGSHPTPSPHTTPSLQTAAASSQLHAQQLGVGYSAPSYPSPPNTAGPSASLLNVSVQPPQPPSPQPVVAPPQLISYDPALQTQVAATGLLPGYPVQQQQQQQQQSGAAVGQALGGFALGVAGGALSAAIGADQGNGGGVGGAIGGALANGLLGGGEGDFLSSVTDGLSNYAVSQNTGNSDLQAALQSQPSTDYQALINSLIQQQATQPQPGADYQALIAQLQQTQASTTGMGVAVAQNSAVYNAQLQANAAAQAQQAQAQVMLQAAAYQQQQQLFQLQLQQQQQILQQQFMQQPPQGQQQAPAATFLTGLGEVLSSSGGEMAASVGSNVLSFLGDAISSE